MEDQNFDVDASLKIIGDVLYKCLRYEPCDSAEIDSALSAIETISNNPEYLRQCEFYFKSSGGSYILFYFSNIIYNLKTKSDLVLSQDVLKWLASVWKNFIQRNKTYQVYIQLHDKFSQIFAKYFPEDSTFITRLNNINLVSEQFGASTPESEAELDKLEKFFQVCEEIISVMKPTFYFIFDFFREMKAFTGESPKEVEFIEKRGLSGFGSGFYTYKTVVIDACKSCAILEAAYLLLKKKKTSRQFRIFDGKKKFLTTSEIYEIYVDKFNFYKKELGDLK
ncbi:MAG: hypothetical protein BWY23_02694 [Spirochaetes bacterium ADurb.Bin218]|jgi:hypothetical protein|nr:MAG: hypothetical protein BWY23_02694 [Spirochaetes bacterium ADurb.Bin218]HOV09453.1 hypothetical protein [Spirochaetota bacterium]